MQPCLSNTVLSCQVLPLSFHFFQNSQLLVWTSSMNCLHPHNLPKQAWFFFNTPNYAWNERFIKDENFPVLVIYISSRKTYWTVGSQNFVRPFKFPSGRILRLTRPPYLRWLIHVPSWWREAIIHINCITPKELQTNYFIIKLDRGKDIFNAFYKQSNVRIAWRQFIMKKNVS